MAIFDNQRIYAVTFFLGATVVVGLLTLQILSPFLAAVAWAIIFAVAAQTPWAFLVRRMPKHRTAAAGLLTLVIGLLFVLPAALLVGVVAGQLIELTGRLTLRLQAAQVHSFSDMVELPAVARVLDAIKDRAGMTPEDFQRLVQGFVNRASEVAPVLSAKLAMSVFDGVMTFAMTLFLLFFFIRDGGEMARAALDLVPVGAEGRANLGRSLGSMVQAIFRGSLLCALAQGVLGGVGWWITGLPLPALAGAAMAILSLLPLGGTAIVWLPGVIYAWSSGHRGAAIFLLVWGLAVVSFLADNILRPLLIRGSEELSTLVVILGVFGGLAAFGLLGIFIGPVVLALAVTLLAALRAEAKSVPAEVTKVQP